MKWSKKYYPMMYPQQEPHQDNIAAALSLLKTIEKLRGKDETKKKEEEEKKKKKDGDKKPQSFSLLETTGLLFMLSGPVAYIQIYLAKSAVSMIAGLFTGH